MEVFEALAGRRTVRRYRQEPVPLATLRRIVDAGRMAASGGNRQPWEFLVVTEKGLLDSVYSEIAWLGGDPGPGERPTAYIVVLGHVRPGETGRLDDLGAAAQNIQLAAWALGVGSCWIGSVNRENIRKLFKIPDTLHICCVVALGFPAEHPAVMETSGEKLVPERDSSGVMKVPKRTLDAVFHHNALKEGISQRR